MSEPSLRLPSTGASFAGSEPARRLGLHPLAWVLVPGSILFSCELGWLYIHVPLNGDHQVYDYVAWVLRQGGTLYRDVADQNWPGAMLLHTLAQQLLGNHLWTWRAFDYGWMLGSCALLFAVSRRFLPLNRAWLVVPIYQLAYVSADRWVTGQRDILAAPLMLLAVLALLRRRRGGTPTWSVLQGTALGAAVLLRPTFLALGAVLAVWDVARSARPCRPTPQPAGEAAEPSEGARRSRGRMLLDHVIAASATLATVGLISLFGAPSGATAAWWETAVDFNLQTYGAAWGSWLAPLALLGRLATGPWAWYLPLAAAGWWLARRRDREATEVLLLPLLATLVSVAVQRKGFSYHMGPFLPVLAVYLAVAVSAASERLALPSARRWPRRLAAAVLLVVTFGFAHKLAGSLAPFVRYQLGRVSEAELYSGYAAGIDEEGFSITHARRLAADLRASTRPDEGVLVWGRPLLVNTLAERRLPTRFASFALLQLANDHGPAGRRWAAELASSLRDHPPAAIVVFRAPAGGWLYLPEDATGPAAIVRATLARDYVHRQSFGPAEVFRRRVESRR